VYCKKISKITSMNIFEELFPLLSNCWGNKSDQIESALYEAEGVNEAANYRL